VIAWTSGGAGPHASARAVPVALAPSARCPAATGAAAGAAIGLARLGMSAAAVRRAYRRSRASAARGSERFCVTPGVVRVGYRDGRVAWILATAPRYALRAVRPGATLASAEAAFPHGVSILVDWTTWYLAPDGRSTAIFESFSDGPVQALGVAEDAVSGTRRQRDALVARLR
jgi:hypothetical protein